MNCILCHRSLKKSASPSMVIGPVCLQKAMPRPKRAKQAAVPVVVDDKTMDMFCHFDTQGEADRIAMLARGV